MVPLLIQLRLAEHADINLRRDLVGVFSSMPAIPPADGLHVSAKIGEELLARRGDVSTVGAGVISSAEQHEVIELQQRLESFLTEQVDTFLDNRVEKLVGRDHVLAYYVSEIISPQVKCGIDRREVALHINQLIFNAPETQA